MAHVLVHIGPHKTGTTSIQKAFLAQREALREAGVLYAAPRLMPERALAAAFSAESFFRHPHMRQHFAGTAEGRAWGERCWVEFEGEVATDRPQLAIISSEHIASVPEPARLIDRLRRSFSRITVVAYVRDPVDLYQSLLQQNIRGGKCLRALPTPMEYRYPYDRLLRRFADLVGAENLVVRNFARENLRGGDVVTDFCAVVSGFARMPPVAPVRVNESLPGAALTWLMLANETIGLKMPLAARRRTLAALQASPEVAALPRLRMTRPRLEQHIRSRTRKTCIWLNDGFLSGQAPLAILPEAEQVQADGDAAAVRAEMRDWLLDYLTPEAQRVIARAVTA